MKNNSNRKTFFRRALLFTLHPEGALPVIRSLNWGGIKCHTITHDHFGIHRFSRYNRVAFTVSKYSLQNGDETFIKRVNKFITKNGIDVIMGTDTDTTRMVIKNHKQWKNVKIFPSPDLNLFEKLQDKWSFSLFVKQCSLPQPETQLISQVDKFDRNKLIFPILLKPRVGAGGIGIIKVNDLASFKTTIEKLKIQNKLPIIAQEYVNGQDIDYNFISKDGEVLSWGVQQRIASEKGLIRFLLNDEVRSICNQLIKYSHYTGIGHIDLRIDNEDGRVKIIEMNPRFWGSIDYSTAMGANFPCLGIRMLMEQSIAINYPPIGDCPYLPISFIAAIRKIFGFRNNIISMDLKRWQKYLWADPAPELINEFRNHIRKFLEAIQKS